MTKTSSSSATQTTVASTAYSMPPSALPPLYFSGDADGPHSQPLRAVSGGRCVELPPEVAHACLTAYSTWDDLARLSLVQRGWSDILRDSSNLCHANKWSLSNALLRPSSSSGGVVGVVGGARTAAAMSLLQELANVPIDHDGMPILPRLKEDNGGDESDNNGDNDNDNNNGDLAIEDNGAAIEHSEDDDGETAMTEDQCDRDDGVQDDHAAPAMKRIAECYFLSSSPSPPPPAVAAAAVAALPAADEREDSDSCDDCGGDEYLFDDHDDGGNNNAVVTCNCLRRRQLRRRQRQHSRSAAAPETSVADPTKIGMRWLEVAHCVGRDYDAGYELALVHEHGKHGADIDVNAAATWFQKSAKEARNLEAMSELALCYELGCGTVIEQCDVQSLDWYLRAAERGHVGSMFSVGEAYEQAKGVPQSDEEAVLWYHRAASRGDVDAQRALLRLHDVARIVVPGYRSVIVDVEINDDGEVVSDVRAEASAIANNV